MVGLIGGLLSNTLWKSVGGDGSYLCGRDIPSGRYDYRRDQTMGGGLSTKRPPYFTTTPVSNFHQDATGLTAHFSKGESCGRDHERDYGRDTKEGVVGVSQYQDPGRNPAQYLQEAGANRRSAAHFTSCGRDQGRGTKEGSMGVTQCLPREADGDWVMFDLTSRSTVPTSAKVKSTLALPSPMPYTTSMSPNTPVSAGGKSKLEFNPEFDSKINPKVNSQLNSEFNPELNLNSFDPHHFEMSVDLSRNSSIPVGKHSETDNHEIISFDFDKQTKHKQSHGGSFSVEHKQSYKGSYSIDRNKQSSGSTFSVDGGAFSVDHNKLSLGGTFSVGHKQTYGGTYTDDNKQSFSGTFPGNDTKQLPVDQNKQLVGGTKCPVKKKHKKKNLSTSHTNNSSSSKLSLPTPGNCSWGQDQGAWPRQCVPNHRLSCLNAPCGNGRICHACAMASSVNVKETVTGKVTTCPGDSDDAPMPSVAAIAMQCDENNTKEIAAASAGVSLNSGSGSSEEYSKMKTKGGVPSIGHREDIRAYDIYQITPHVSTEAHYSRLPTALPTLTDSDSDPDDLLKPRGETSQGARKRKRKIPHGRRDNSEGGKRQRDTEEGRRITNEGEEKTVIGLDDITVYTSPYLEDYTNRISILHRLSSNTEEAGRASHNTEDKRSFSNTEAGKSSSNAETKRSSFNIRSSSNAEDKSPSSNTDIGRSSSNTQRRVSFSITEGHFHQEDPTTSTTAYRIPPASSSSGHKPPPPTPTHGPYPAKHSPLHPPRRYDENGDDDDDMNNDVDDDDDDDDDETSTVVPDDFEDETDSDIEVLTQSADSWVDLSNQPEESPDRVTPLPFGNGEEYIRLLREAQKESNHSSARVSLASSRRDTPRDSPHDSPKSPPNSPNTELTTDPEEVALKGVYINYYNKEGDFIRVEKNTETDWIWDWSSRPDQTPPKEWRFSHPGKGVNRGASIRRVMVGKSSLFSRDVLYTLLITNVLSLIIGTGIGIWLSKRSSSGAIVTLPIN